MCGRLALFSPPASFARYLEATLGTAYATEPSPSWNVPPTSGIPGLLLAPNGSGRVLSRFRWGLLPHWAKDASFSSKTFNARAETVATKPSFRAAFAARHLLVPMDGYYEWATLGPTLKQPYFITRADGAPLVAAGLWEEWRDPAGGADAPVVRSCTIITTAAGADVGHLHDRMPVVVEPDRFDLWLDAGASNTAAVEALLQPAPAGTLQAQTASKAVGSIRNDGPQLLVADPDLEGAGST